MTGGGAVTGEAYDKAEKVRTPGLGLVQNLWFIPEGMTQYGIKVTFPAEAAANIRQGSCHAVFNRGVEGPIAPLAAGAPEVIMALPKGSVPTPSAGAPTVLLSCDVDLLDPGKKAPFNDTKISIVRT